MLTPLNYFLFIFHRQFLDLTPSQLPLGGGIALLTYILNNIIRLHYVPSRWKFTKIIMILKVDEPLEIPPTSYRPIS